MREALGDEHLFAPIMGGSSWYSWRVLLIAAAGEALNDDEREEFKRLTGREREPGCPCRELIVVAGRRAGKSTAAVVFDIWLAALCDWRGVLAMGETGVALLVSRDQRVAKMLLDRNYGIMAQSEPLNSMIINKTAETIELRNGISIEVRPCNYRLRGPTFISVICDELAFWFTSSDFANPDTEVLTAVRPGRMTTNGPILMVSSAYAQRGELYDNYRKYFGPSGPPDILVAHGGSRDFNPSLDQAEIDRELEKDPVRNRAEYLSEFRADVEGFIPREVVEACVGPYVELPPQPGIAYRCFLDPASGVDGGDSLAAVVGHKHGGFDAHVTIDAIREVKPPFNFFEVCQTILLPLCKTYNITSITGDNYGGELAKEPVRAAGITYELAKKHTSALYLDPFLGMLNARKIDLPRHERAINQICGLERSVQRSGRDQITHATHGHDDIANAIAGVVDLAANYSLFDTSWNWVSGPVAAAETDAQRRARQKQEAEDWHAARLRNYLAMHGAFGWPPFQ